MNLYNIKIPRFKQREANEIDNISIIDMNNKVIRYIKKAHDITILNLGCKNSL